ncbi:MAG: hypothetical protein N2171_00170 [Clostridia bacterium]|nr:hypothetical protein [Clostridia bacterium]
MKGKLFKKIVAGVAAFAMAAQFAVILPLSASAEGEYWTENFETSTVGATPTGWTSQYSATGLLVNTNTNTSINNYLRFVSTGSGPRTAYYTLGSAAQTVDANSKSVLEFDFFLTNSSGYDYSQIGILNSSAGTPTGNAVYTGTAYILLLNQRTTSSQQLIINDTTSTTTDAASNKTHDYTYGTWAHAKAIMDFATDTVVLKITSLDGSTTYFEEKQISMGSNASAPGKILLTAARGTAPVGIDNIVFRPLTSADQTQTYRIVTYSVNGSTYTESVVDGGTVANVPSTTALGKIFQGWYVGSDTSTLYTTDQIKAMTITADTTFKAAYADDPNYIEALSSIAFSTYPSSGLLSMGANTDTYASNNFVVSLTGERGTDLVAKPDSRVTDYNVVWEFNGFRTLNGKPTGDVDADSYCDSYAKVTTSGNTANFQLKQTSANYYGRVKATVTYNGVTKTVEKPIAILGNTVQSSNVLLPKAGYISDFNNYEDSMVGYSATVSSDNKSATDVVTGGWGVYGSNTGRNLVIAKDADGSKYLKLQTSVASGSCFAANVLSSANEQVIFEQNVRFHTNNTSILYKTDNPVTWTTGKATTFSLNFASSAININGTNICSAATDVWYKIVISSDVTVGTCWAAVYDQSGNLLGKSDPVAFADAGSLSPVYYCFRTPDSTVGSVDFNNVKAFKPVIDESTFKINTTAETIVVPETDTAENGTATLTASVKSTDGYDISGIASWAIGIDGVEDTVKLSTTGTDAHSATITVKKGAPSGELPINVTIGGVTKTITLNLTSSQDNVAFTSAPTSISIPLDSSTSKSTYAAVVKDGSGNVIEGRTIQYAMYDKSNTNEITSLTGITFDKSTATLSVTSDAVANVVYIRATSTNSEGGTISKSIKVTIHGLLFDFGAGTDADLVEGYTAVTPSTEYTSAKGYGITGTVTAGGTVTDSNKLSTDYLTGSSFVFKANVIAGKRYEVKIGYCGVLETEKFDQYLTGHLRNMTGGSTNTTYTDARDLYTTITELTYTIACVDGVLDLNFSADSSGNKASVAYVEITKLADKTKSAKPAWYAIGDSTVGNNGSWGYELAKALSTYDTNSTFSAMYNYGKGSRNTTSYYNQGWLDAVLTSINPGDVVTISGLGTNGWSGTIDDFKSAMKYYIEACYTMGAKVVVGSYTSHGPFGSYASALYRDSDGLLKYNGSRDSWDEYERVVKALAEEEIAAGKAIGYVDIGNITDTVLTADAQALDAANLASGMTNDASLASVLAKFTDATNYYSDHNHYKSGFSAEILPYIVSGVAGIYSNSNMNPTVGTITYDGTTASVPFTSANGASTYVYVAEYDANGLLVGVNMAQKTFASDSDTVTVSYTKTSSQNKIKVFVWNAKMKSYTSSVAQF